MCGTAGQSVWLDIDCEGGVACNKNGKVGRPWVVKRIQCQTGEFQFDPRDNKEPATGIYLEGG